MSFFFIQMADPQFGMFAALSGLSEDRVDGMGLRIRSAPRVSGFADETVLYQRAIADANRLRPSFVVMCGDFVNDQDDHGQLSEFRRITDLLDPAIPMYLAAGNHDIGNTPTPRSLVDYRDRYGQDNYSFDYGGSHFLVLNSCIAFDPTNVREEWDRQIEFVTQDLVMASGTYPDNILVFMHHPLFLDTPQDGDNYLVIPNENRGILLDIFKSCGVTAVFTGHCHRNNLAEDGDLCIVTTGPVGYPAGEDPSGFRIVKVNGKTIEHEYYGFDHMPEYVDMS